MLGRQGAQGRVLAALRAAAALAHAVNLEMHDWWTPTAAGYFDHVSKAKVLEAVQLFAPGEVHRLAKLKKAQIAAEAERLAAGSGWLPVMFRKLEVTDTLNQRDAGTDVDAQSGPEVKEFEEMNA